MEERDEIQTACSDMLAGLVGQTFSVMGLLLVIFGIDWRLALFSMALFPFVLAPTVRIGRKIRRTSRSTQEAMGDVNQGLQEAIAGHQVVRGFSAEVYEAQQFY